MEIPLWPQLGCGGRGGAQRQAEGTAPFVDGEPRLDDLLGQPSDCLKMARWENCGGRVKILEENVCVCAEPEGLNTFGW